MAVPSFQNSTEEPGAETYFTNAILEEMIRANFLQVVERDRAEVILEGKVSHISHSPQGVVTSAENAQLPANTILNINYTTFVRVNLSLRRKQDQKVLWSGEFVGSKITPAGQIGAPGVNSSNPVYDYSAKHRSLRDLSRQVMREAFSRMTEGF